ncbi:hypothetical protein [Agromyces silvae]|uniref:hypothetical protein n=1 Tax=Agromyces silvae TaxID=3388266 RepID=UPI00280AE875|nr:hypothetical protein [Agromyces protaetiae]
MTCASSQLRNFDLPSGVSAGDAPQRREIFLSKEIGPRHPHRVIAVHCRRGGRAVSAPPLIECRLLEAAVA